MDIWVVSPFWLLWIISAMNTCGQVFVWTSVFNSGAGRGGVVGIYLEVELLGPVETLNSLRNHQIVFHSNHTIYISANNGWALKFSSVVRQFSGSVMSNSLWPHRLQQCQASLYITNCRSLLKLSSVVRRIIIVSQGLTTPCMWSDGNSAVLHSRCCWYPAHYALHTTATHTSLTANCQSWRVLTTRDCFNHTQDRPVYARELMPLLEHSMNDW